MKRALKWTAAALAIVVGAWMIANVVTIAAGQRESQEDRDDLNAEVDELKAANTVQQALIDEANRRLEEAGQQPVDEPEEIPAPSSDLIPFPGPMGPRGPSCIEEIGLLPCRGDKGAPSTVPGPVGEASTVPGPKGEDSTVPGPKGDKGEKGDKGDRGDRGEPGEPGSDGVSPSGSAACPDGQFATGYAIAEGVLTITCAPFPQLPADPGQGKSER